MSRVRRAPGLTILPDPQVRLRLLRSFELSYGDHVAELPLGAQQALAFLALHNLPLFRTFVAQSLWMDMSEERAAANLRTTLWRIRRLDFEVVASTATHVRLATSVEVDYLGALRQAQRLVDPAQHCEGPDLIGDSLYGDLLPGWYEDWVVIEQERYRQIRLHALEALCERLIMIGRYAEAVQAGLAAVGGEPLRESAQRILIKAHLAEGNQIEALRQYRRYRGLLEDGLGLDPSQRIEDLVAGLAAR